MSDTPQPDRRLKLDLVAIFYFIALLLAGLMLINFAIHVGKLDYILFGSIRLVLDFSNLAGVSIPFNVMIDVLVLYNTVYGGAEGFLSASKTIALPEGEAAPVPSQKLFWLSSFIFVWFTLIAFDFALLFIANKEIEMYLGDLFVGFGSSTTTYVWARKAKVLAPLTKKRPQNNPPPPAIKPTRTKKSESCPDPVPEGTPAS